MNKKIEIKIAENKTPYQNQLDNNNENKLLFLIEKTKRKKKLSMNNNNELMINNDKNSIRKNILEKNFYKESKKSKKNNKFICHNVQKEKIYRKDYYYKHFKAIFGKYVKNKIND